MTAEASPDQIVRWSGIAALAFGLAALTCSLAIVFQAIGGDWMVLLATSTIAASATGFIAWALLLKLAGRVALLPGIAAGVVVSIVAHPIAWYLAIVVLYVSGARSSLGERTLDPVAGVGAALLFSALSLITVGWITAPLGGLTGGILSMVQRRLERRPTSPA